MGARPSRVGDDGRNELLDTTLALAEPFSMCCCCCLLPHARDRTRTYITCQLTFLRVHVLVVVKREHHPRNARTVLLY